MKNLKIKKTRKTEYFKLRPVFWKRVSWVCACACVVVGVCADVWLWVSLKLKILKE